MILEFDILALPSTLTRARTRTHMETWRIRASVTFTGVDNVISQKYIDRVLSEAVAEVVLVVAHGRVV